MDARSRQVMLMVGLLLATVSAEAQFGDFLKTIPGSRTSGRQEQVERPAADADAACPKCGGTGSISRGFKSKKCKACGGTGVARKQAAAAPADVAPADATPSADVSTRARRGRVQKNDAVAGTEEVVIFDDITVDELKTFLVENTNCLLLDVREPDEFASGHIKGAVNIPVGQVARRIGSVCPDKARDIYVYCQSGKRSRMAAQQLSDMDYTMVHNVLRGLNAWNGRLVR